VVKKGALASADSKPWLKTLNDANIYYYSSPEGMFAWVSSRHGRNSIGGTARSDLQPIQYAT